MQMLLDNLKIKPGLITFGWEIMIKLVNGVPERLVEMDEKVKFLRHVDSYCL